MALADLAARPPAGPAHKQCGTCWALTQLDPDTATHLRNALGNPRVKYAEVWVELDKLGFGLVDVNALQRHARGQCSAHEVLRGKANT